jgi:lysozyme
MDRLKRIEEYKTAQAQEEAATADVNKYEKLLGGALARKADAEHKRQAARADLGTFGPDEDLYKLIKSYEGFVDHPYNDSANNATIGYGHLIHLGPVTADDRTQWGTITETEAARLLSVDLQPRLDVVNKYVKVKLTRNQFNALVSLVYNIGEGNFSTSSVVKNLNAGKIKEAADAFLLWNKETKNGKLVVSEGLTNRRKAERTLFLK